MLLRKLCLFLVLASSQCSIAEDRPNILLILADDLGWSHLGCYGGTQYRTPNLDQLCQEGIKFTQAYSAAPICSASRASLLTGQSTARTKLEFVVKRESGYQPISTRLRAPPYTINLPLEETTLPEVLASTGYQSAFFGKWHLNAHYQRYLGWSPTHGPKAQGFDVAIEDFGNHPYSYWGKGKQARQFADLPEGAFPADGMTRRAIRFIEQSGDQPFFLLVSHFYVHDPNHTRLKWLYDDQIASIAADHPRRDQLAHYQAMVATLDHHVGQLLDALQQSGKRESTLVLFSSDNGSHPNYAGNAPLRGSKWNLYEGGIRVPLLARWPGHLPAGSQSKVPVWLPDLFPTLAEITGASYDSTEDAHGISALIPQTRGSVSQRPMVWHFPYYHPEKNYKNSPSTIGIDDGVTSQTEPQSAIRIGNFKLIHFYESNRDELYDIENDPSESQDLSRSQPERALTMHQQLFDYLKRVDARLPTAHPGDSL